jgi:opacity protein-like surface antigen
MKKTLDTNHTVPTLKLPSLSTFLSSVVLALVIPWGNAFAQENPATESAPSVKSTEANTSNEASEEEEGEGDDTESDSQKSKEPEKAKPEARPPAPLKKEETKPSTPAVDQSAANEWHLLTPEWAENKLQVRFGLGLGGGTKEFAADRLGFAAEAAYYWKENVFTGVHYSSISGVKTSNDESYAGQSFLLGGGVQQKLKGSKFLESLAFRGAGFLGFSRLSHWDLANFKFQKPIYSAAGSINVSLDWSVWEKSFLFVGAGSQLGKAQWTDAQLGVASFF